MNKSYFSKTCGTFIASNNKIYNKDFYKSWTVVDSLSEDVINKGLTSPVSISFGLNSMCYRFAHTIQSFSKNDVIFDETMLGQGEGIR